MNGNGRLTFEIYGGISGSNNLSTADGALDLGVTILVAAVFNFDEVNGTDNVMEVYVDRMLVASLNAGATTPFYGDTVSDFWMGSVHDNGNPRRCYPGDLTDVKISDMALTESEMLLVPEPGMLAIFGMGLLALGLTRRKRI